MSMKCKLRCFTWQPRQTIATPNLLQVPNVLRRACDAVGVKVQPPKWLRNGMACMHALPPQYVDTPQQGQEYFLKLAMGGMLRLHLKQTCFRCPISSGRLAMLFE
jgi:hypothetical protein